MQAEIARPSIRGQASNLGVQEAVARQGLFSTVKPRKVTDVVYRQLVSLIATGRLKPGERLPSERAMALEMGVSRQSVREVIHRARAEGLLEVRQGGGTFVISSLKASLNPPLSILLEGQAENIFEFLEIRRLIEAWCAERAAAGATRGDLRRIRGFLARMEQVKPPEEAWEKADLEFHSAIAAATHNVIAMHLMKGLEESFHAYFKMKQFTTRSERKEDLLRQHKAIFEAIRKGDGKAAKQSMLEHLDYVRGMIAEDLPRSRERASEEAQ